MANSWNPLFDLLESSLLGAGPDAVAVFMVLLSRADKNGETRAVSPIALADRLRIPVERVRQAFVDLQRADEDSRTRTEKGAHLVWVPDDEVWLIPSHAKWRRLASQERRKEAEAERQRRRRSGSADQCEAEGCTEPAAPGYGVRVCPEHAFDREPGAEG